MGFCFGGTTVLELARSGAPLQAVISFHGGLDTPHPEDAKAIKGKVLALHGADDPNVPPEQVAAFEKEMAAAGDTPTSRAKRARVYAAVGDKEESRKIVDELIRTKQTQHITPYEIGVIYALLEEADKSIEWLKKAMETHAVGFSFARVDPQLDYLRGNPKFENLLKKEELSFGR
jgi:hypothetical protein